jgi:hypothetical protein
MARKMLAFLTPWYFLAMSLNDGAVSSPETAWQLRHCFYLARSSIGSEVDGDGAEASTRAAPMARLAQARVISFFITPSCNPSWAALVIRRTTVSFVA